jgi:ubiquinone/menaquinone biosynthesis C-methylase UbiE
VQNEVVMSVQEKQLVPPIPVIQLFHANWGLRILTAAMELNLFVEVGGKNRSAAEVAKQISASERGVEVLLDALVGLGFIRRENGTYSLAPVSEIYLLPSSRLYMGDYLSTAHDLSRQWQHLAECVKTGKPVSQVNTAEEAEQFFPALAQAIFPLNYATAKQAARDLNLKNLPAGSKALDIAAGSGVWSLAAAEDNANLHVDALDFPAVLEVTKKFAEKFGVAAQYSYLSGDWRDQTIADSSYDVIFLGHILHSEGLERSIEMLERCFRWLKKGGRLVIGEFMPNEDRKGPADTLMFDVTMFIVTTSGCVFTPNQLKKICTDAGFSDCYRMEIPGVPLEKSQVMIATK